VSRFAVQTARTAWPEGPDAGKNALCEAWIAQASEIEKAELESGADRTYVAWASIAALNKDAEAAYRKAGDPGGAPAGSAFAALFVGPAAKILGDPAALVLWAIKHAGLAKEDGDPAKAALAIAAGPVLDLAKKDLGSIPAVRREEEEAHWVSLLTGLQKSMEVLETLCPRMMSVRNAAKTCGLARERAADGCIVLLDGGKIKALATRTLGAGLTIHEITVEPQALRDKVRGIGGTLMEYLIREAAAAKSGAGVNVTLLPIGHLAMTFYRTMGFEPAEPDWVMNAKARQEYLKKHREFEAAFKALT